MLRVVAAGHGAVLLRAVRIARAAVALLAANASVAMALLTLRIAHAGAAVGSIGSASSGLTVSATVALLVGAADLGAARSALFALAVAEHRRVQVAAIRLQARVAGAVVFVLAFDAAKVAALLGAP